MAIKLEITKRVIIRRFQRRRRIALTALVLGLLAGLLFRYGLPSDARGTFTDPWTTVQVEAAIFFILVSVLVAVLVFKCPNCQKAPWSGGTFSVSPKRCGACKVQLRDE